uniref:Cytoplasmic dynein 1 intermediate chain n=1 Tax=Cacopsylla melanoneura TaxID=428564 RepID=A0A8D9B8K6_9HEMI
MADRKAELEKKRIKLQAMREEKERRRKEKELKDAEEAAGRSGVMGDKDQRKELDSMLSSLGVAPVADVMSSLSSVSANGTPESNNTPDTSILNAYHSTRKPRNKLCTVRVQETNIPPKEVVLYAKQTQTANTSGVERDGYFEDWWRPRKAQSFGYYDEYNLNPGLEWDFEFTVLTYDEAEDEDNSLINIDGFNTSKLPPGILPHGLPQVKDVKPAVTSLEHTEVKKEEPKPIVELSEDEKLKITLSEEFQHFVSRTGRVMERLLAEKSDMYKDYMGLGDADEIGDEKSSTKLNFSRQFFDEKWSKNRNVTYMDWSSQHPELLLASYHRNKEAPNEPDGVCLIWNTKFKKTTPEFEFFCQSPVLSCCFAKFNPYLILGGTYSGQIVLWDTRVQKKTPVHRTPLSVSAHTHPVFCMSVIGTQNAHNLISISNDGRLCSWSLEMLSSPQETRDLQYNNKQTKNLAVLSLAFPQNDVNNFVVGCEDGNVYSACRHGNKAGNVECYESHEGPVVGLSSHRAQGHIDFSHLVLTSSYDWSVKLWNIKENKPVHSFNEFRDYVMDVQWSPINPALFATVEVGGRVDLWNLNIDTEVPATSAIVEGAPALNRVSWTPNGTQLCVGDEKGVITMFDVGEQLAQPRSDEWSKMLHTLQELKNNGAYYAEPNITDKTPSLTSTSSLGYSSGPASLTSLPK